MFPFATSIKKAIKKQANKLFALATMLFIHVFAIAQQASETATGKDVQMADGLRSSGKIYVVVAVLLTVLSGLFLYVIRLDRKISKMENK